MTLLVARADTKPASPQQTGNGRKRLPLDVRLMLCEEVLTLRNKAYSYSRIRTEIAKRHNISLAKGTVSGWVRGINTPSGAGHLFVPKPAPELSYVIGVRMGDASLNVKAQTYQYRIRLQAVDREFVEAFNQAVSKVLGSPPHRLWRGDTARETHVEFGSYLLYRFLRQPFEVLVPFVEHCQDCAAAFLRGFFDSEGCVDKEGRLTVCNSNIGLLRYAQSLLAKYFHVETTGPHIGTRRGSLLIRRGRTYRRNTDVYSVYVRSSSVRKFYESVGVTIERKAARLERSLHIPSSNSSEDIRGHK